MAAGGGGMRQLTKYLVFLIGLASLVAVPALAHAQALVPYYVYTGQTGAQTQVDVNHKSSFTISAANDIDFYGGSFVMKAGSSASTPITLTLYDSAAKTNVLSSVTLTTSQFCAVHGGNCSSYDVTKFDLPSPVRLSAGRAYYAELTSRAPDTQSLAYFIKGGNSCYIATANGATLADSQCSYTYTPQTGGSPSLQISKSGPSTAEAGVPYSYTLTVKNVGDGDALAGTVKDQLPSGLSFVSATGAGWTCSASGSPALVTCRYSGSIAARGGTSTISITAKAGAAGTFVNWASIDPTGGTVPTTPSAASCAGLSQTVCDSAATVVTAAAPELSITKLAPVPALDAGAQSTYTLKVENAGGAPATAVQVKDQLPSGMSFVSASGAGWSCAASNGIVTCNYSGSIAPAGSSSVSVVVSLPAGASGAYENRAFVNVDGTPINTVPTACTSDATISCSSNTSTVDAGLLKIEKSAPSPELQVGAESTYTLTITNVGGGSIIATSAALKDLLPAYVDLVSASSGWRCVPRATASPASNAPLTVACALASPINLAANESISLALTVKPRSGVAASVTNYAAVDPTGGNTPLTPGPSCPDATSCAENTANVKPALPDLIVNKLAPLPALAGGEQSTYPINVVNQGEAAASFAQVKDQLPQGMNFVSASGAGWSCSAADGIVSCNFSGSIAPGQTSAINITVSLPPEATSGSYENRAFVNRDGSPLGPLPSACTTDATTSCSANISTVEEGLLQIEKSGPSSALQVGVEGTYTISVTNIGGSAVRSTRAALKDLMPAYVDLVAVSAGWACTPETTAAPVSNAPVEVSCALAAPTIIGVNKSKTLELTVRPRAGVAASVTNYAAVDPTGGNTPLTPGPNCADPTACAEVTSGADPSRPELTVTKLAPVPALKPGARSIYTINVENAGDGPATFAQVKDQLPAGMSFIRAAGSGWVCEDSGSANVICNFRGLIAPGETSSIEMLVSLPSDASGTYENRAYVKEDGTPVGPLPRSCTTGSAINCSSNTSTIGEGLLAIDKSEPEPALQLGVESTYTITVTNVGGGPVNATTVDLKDLLPAYLDLVAVSPGWSCSPGGSAAPVSNAPVEISCALSNAVNIPVNGTKTLQLGVKPRAGIAEAVTNYAAVDPTGGETPLTPGPNCTDATSCAEQTSEVDPSLPELTVRKLAPVPALTAGSRSTYKIIVENEGGAAAPSIQVKDRLPAGMAFISASGASSGWECSADGNGVVSCDYSGSLAPGGVSSIDVVVSLPADASGEYENLAFVNRDGSAISEVPDVCTSDATLSCSSNTSTVDAGLLKIEKSAPDPALQVGEESTYTITVSNVGSGPIVDTTANIKDVMPAYLDLVAVSPGWRCTPGSSASPASDTEVEIDCALAVPTRIGVDKTRTLQLTVKPRTGVAASVTNYAAVDPTGGDSPLTPGPECTDATSCAEQTSDVAQAQPELAVRKLAPEPALAAGGQSTYTIEVENAGSLAATSAQVKDQLPETMEFVSASGEGWRCRPEDKIVTCDLDGTIEPGTTSAISVVVSLPEGASGSYENRAFVKVDGTPINQLPKSCQSDSAISCSSNTSTVGEGLLAIEKSAPNPALQIGAESTYTITITNVGGGTIDATTASVKDLMPAYVDLVSVSSGWSCTLGSTHSPQSNDAVEVGCALSAPVSLAPDATQTLELTVKPRPGVAASVTNYASVDPTGGDTPLTPGPECADATSCAEKTSSVAPASSIRIEKSSPDAEFVANAEAHYTLTVTNASAVEASDVTIVEDRLPAGMSFVSAAGKGWACSSSGEAADGALITCKRKGPFAGSSDISVVTLPGASLAGTTVTNWTSAGTGPDEAAAQPPEPYQCTEPSVCDSLERFVASSGFTIAKSQPSPELAVGKRSVYTISVTTDDSGTATEVKDQLPVGMTLVAARGKGWSCEVQAGNLLTCGKSFAAGKTEKIEVEVEVGPSLNNKRVTNYASVGPQGQAPQPGPKCAASSEARFCASSTAKVSDIRDRISKAVEEDVQAFMASRLDRLVSFAGRGSRLQHFRNTQCGWNHEGALNGEGTEKSAQFDGAASFDLRLPGKMVVPTADAPPEQCSGLNVWSELEFDYVAGREGASSQTAMATVGLEYLLTPSILAGVRATFDYTDFDMDGASEANSQITGQGWFAGPYVSAELVQNIFLDAFLGYGTSWNDYTGRFEGFDLAGEFTTQRLLAGATLTGQFESGAFLFSPSAGVAYGKEWSDSFSVDNDRLGSTSVDGKAVELTRLSAEFETTYRTTVGDGNPFEVFVAPTITYDFFQNAGEEADDILGGDLRGGVDGGFRFSDENFNMSLRVGYDGIGLQDWGAYKGEVQFNYTW